MLFNSLQFFVFFIFVTSFYFSLNHKYRWLLLLLASCYFYMAFIPKYLAILGVTIVIDYTAGIFIENATGKRRKLFLVVSLLANMGMLAAFKYFNFLNGTLTDVLYVFDKQNPVPFLAMVLPIGLSFHTFQAISYTIEVYRGNQKAERHFGIYALYVMFYPQLVAGPIERPQNLLHQFRKNHHFNMDEFKAGLLQMAFGLFKKVVIADRLAMAVDHGFGHHAGQSGLSLLIAAVFYSFQIYCDFSGYSDMAIGAARCMGFRLMTNFNAPYFARSVTAFWKRWHISLSTWFKDYLYFPMGGSRVAKYRGYFNIFVVFMLSGLWHGANWTFVCWGALHGLMVITDKALSAVKHHLKLPRINTAFLQVLQVTTTFLLVTLAWVFFRAPDIQQAITIIDKIFTLTPTDTITLGINDTELLFSFILIALLILVEKCWPKLQSLRIHSFSYGIIFMSLLFACYSLGVFNYNQFVYFQF